MRTIEVSSPQREVSEQRRARPLSPPPHFVVHLVTSYRDGRCSPPYRASYPPSSLPFPLLAFTNLRSEPHQPALLTNSLDFLAPPFLLRCNTTITSRFPPSQPRLARTGEHFGIAQGTPSALGPRRAQKQNDSLGKEDEERKQGVEGEAQSVSSLCCSADHSGPARCSRTQELTLPLSLGTCTPTDLVSCPSCGTPKMAHHLCHECHVAFRKEYHAEAKERKAIEQL
jgi:ribosomal protein L32